MSNPILPVDASDHTHGNNQLNANNVVAAGGAAAIPSPPSSYTVILFYLYTTLSEPLSIVSDWQRTLCEQYGLLGRIRIASEGINATLAGSASDIQSYIQSMRNESPPFPHPDANRKLFAPVEYKFSISTSQPFDSLGMFIVPELCATGKMGKSRPPGLIQSSLEMRQQRREEEQYCAAADASDMAVEAAAAVSSASSSVNSSHVSDMHLSPTEFHSELSSFDPSTTLLLDTRNAYETAIGSFTHATDPKIRAFHQLPEYVNQNLSAIRAKKKILMYCTGSVIYHYVMTQD
jgi:UPF0176 protein